MNDYQDGCEQGQTDARNNRPHDDQAPYADKPPVWREGYRAGYALIEQTRGGA